MKRLIPPAPLASGKLRQEIFALGDRHRGDPLAGARRELTDPDLTPERRALLRAVVTHLAGGGTGGEGAAKARLRPASVVDLVYLTVIAAAAAWTTIMVWSLLS